MSPKSTPSKPLSYFTLLVTALVVFLLCISPASALAVPNAPARAKSLAPSADALRTDPASHPVAVPGSKNLPFELPPCEDEAACAEALWRAGSRVNANSEAKAPSDGATRSGSGSSRSQKGSKDGGVNRYTALTEQLSGKRKPFEAPEWSRIF